MPAKQLVPVLFLASAVSDFYIPFDLLPEHKMQSRQLNSIAKEAETTEGSGNNQRTPELVISLFKTPKLLSLVRALAPDLKMVTFKLETDESILEQKVLNSFHENQSDFIVGNLLQTKESQIIVYKKLTPGNQQAVTEFDSRKEISLEIGEEVGSIERKLVQYLEINF